MQSFSTHEIAILPVHQFEMQISSMFIQILSFFSYSIKSFYLTFLQILWEILRNFSTIKSKRKTHFHPQNESETAVHNCRQFSVKIVIKRNWCCKWVKALSRVFRIRNFHFNLSKWGAKCDTVFLFQWKRETQCENSQWVWMASITEAIMTLHVLSRSFRVTFNSHFISLNWGFFFREIKSKFIIAISVR